MEERENLLSSNSVNDSRIQGGEAEGHSACEASKLSGCEKEEGVISQNEEPQENRQCNGGSLVAEVSSALLSASVAEVDREEKSDSHGCNDSSCASGDEPEDVEGAEEDGTEESEEREEAFREMSLEALTQLFKETLGANYDPQTRGRLDLLKAIYYSKLNLYHEEEQTRRKQGGVTEEEAGPVLHATEEEMRGHLERYRAMRLAYNERQEAERQQNLEKKRSIVDKIKELTTRDEVLGETYREFDALRKAWGEIGPVPGQEVKDLYESYNHAVQQFYDYLRINKELRDLDYRKNLELKIKLCEQAEDLITVKEEAIPQAFKDLQSLHEQWKEIGPVMREKSDEIWERFSAASSVINTRHRQFYEQRTIQQEENHTKKLALTERLEQLLMKERTLLKEWIADSNAVIAMQKEWKLIGPVPRKHSNALWARFRGACDTFFAARREFDTELQAQGAENLQRMMDLCAQAEALKDSEDWGPSSRTLMDLQRLWKEIGYAPRKKGQELWERFHGACNHFFERRNANRDAQKAEFAENLKLKREIVHELQHYEFSEDSKRNLEWLKEIQSRWNNIGFVPAKFKDELNQQYRQELDRHYARLHVTQGEESVGDFRKRMEDIMESGDSARFLQNQQRGLRQRVKAIEAEKLQMETNLSFFTNASGESPILEKFRGKIEALDGELNALQEKLRHLDRLSSKAEEGENRD